MVKDKVVFITGAASGIGLATARHFAQAGAQVIICDIDANKLDQAVREAIQDGLLVTGKICDVTQETAIQATVNAIAKEFGRIDIVINNAGLQHVAVIEEFPSEKFELLIRVMLIAPFLVTQLVFPLMKKQGWGRIINMASINGLVGFAGKAAYNSAKHGVIGLTKVAALEGAAHGITANALCPGYVDTPLVRNQLADLARSRNVAFERVLEEVIYPMVPQKRLLSVDEVADYAIFLASDKARGITGQAVVIDGGYTAQ
jgi:3-hydroxybutyrate dehydrogenase